MTITEKLALVQAELEQLRVLAAAETELAQLKSKLGLTDDPAELPACKDVVVSNVVMQSQSNSTIDLLALKKKVQAMGAAWFISIAFDSLVSPNKNWHSCPTWKMRKSTYDGLTEEQVKAAAGLVAEMSVRCLDSNKIGLSGKKVHDMAIAVRDCQ